MSNIMFIVGFIITVAAIGLHNVPLLITGVAMLAVSFL